ncbi:glycosyltransferase [Psychrobacillus soli]|uniref:Glycosyltransferase n=1 Tax=Psychrobacillus soli TaxID=1543965 RepID=A0A544TL69_9BACI|nr:glycosyltransferase [Psychrobacillus soli]TQR18155.1 glycosyltransferase [Psychrobacillus soli]
MKKKVAVVIPCFNYGQYIEEAVDSCLSSTYEELEIIVVDDGSTDPYTIEKLKQIAKKPKTKICRQENGGLSAARNFGFRNTDAEYVLTLDADDKIAPTFIEKALWILEKYDNYNYVYSLVQLFGEQQKVWETLPYNLSYLKYRNTIPATIFIKHSAWETIGGYDEKMLSGYEDWEFIIRLGKNNLIGFHINEILFFYRKHHGSMLGDSKKKHSALVKYIREKHSDIYKYYSFPSFLFFECKRRVSKLKKNIYITLKEGSSTSWKHIFKRIIHGFNSKYNEKDIYLESITKETVLQDKKANEKMRVLIILPWLNVGGVEKVFLNLMKQLKGTVDFYVVTTEGQLSHVWEEKFGEVAKEVQHLGMFLSDDEERLAYLNYLIESLNVDIIHLSNSRFGYRALKFIKDNHPSIKIIDTLHMEEPWSTWDYFRLSAPYDSLINHRVVLTEYQRDRLKNITDNNRANIIPNGIEIEEYDFKVKSEKNENFNIAFIGRLTKQKQPLIYLETARLAKEKNLPFKFHLIGNGELLSKCKKYIKKNDLFDYVILQGFTNDINTTFKKTDVLCMPSIIEGLPITGLEAMAVGVPILATDVPGWNDLITHKKNGMLSQHDAKSLLVNLEKLYSNVNLYNSIRKNAKNEVMKYSNKKMAESYLKLYSNLLEDKVRISD